MNGYTAREKRYIMIFTLLVRLVILSAELYITTNAVHFIARGGLEVLLLS